MGNRAAAGLCARRAAARPLFKHGNFGLNIRESPFLYGQKAAFSPETKDLAGPPAGQKSKTQGSGHYPSRNRRRGDRPLSLSIFVGC